MAAGMVSEEQAAVIVRGVDALPGRAPPRRRAPPDRPRRRARPGRAARLPTGSSRSSPPRSPKPTSCRPCSGRKRSRRSRAGSPCPTTGTACATAGSPCPATSARCSSRPCWRSTHPSTATHSGTPQGLGHAFCEYVTRYPIDRLPKAGGVDATVVVTMTLENLTGTSEAARDARHRRPDHRRPGPQARLRGRHHPDRPQRTIRGPRPGPRPTLPHQGPTDRHRPPRQALHRRRLRLARRDVPRPPQHAVEPEAARPPSPTAGCCARGTTPTPTTRSTR